MKNSRSINYIFLCIGLWLSVHTAHATDLLEASDAWIRQSPPTLKVNAGYLTLTNRSEQSQTIIAANSTLFGHTMLHTTRIDQGMAKMEHMKKLTIKPGATIKLEPGGMHLMLMMRKQPLEVGDKVEINLLFENGAQQLLSFTVRRP